MSEKGITIPIKPIWCEIIIARKLMAFSEKCLARLDRIEISNVIYHEIGIRLCNRQKAFADLDPATDGNIYQLFCYLQKEMADTIFNNFITIIGSVDSKSQELKAWRSYGISSANADKLRTIRERYAHIRNNLISHINDVPEKEILKNVDEISQEQVEIDSQIIREVLNEAKVNQGLSPIFAMWPAEKQYPVQGLKNLFELLEGEKNEM